jgi:phosphoribosylaminoimidazolecarboxamide formyltransferase / IMP cyclohydrolase
MAENGITCIDLVVLNLYAFEHTVAKGADFATCIENIDIGGPSMLRSSSKNHNYVTISTDPAQYPELMAELQAHGGSTTLALRKRFAAKAFATSAAYDSAIASWINGQLGADAPVVRIW